MSLSVLMRQSSSTDHKIAEQAPFVSKLMAGDLTATAYVRYLNQLAFVYRALEAKLPETENLPFDRRLKRSAAIEADLTALGVESWDSTPMLTSTEIYVERLTSLAGPNDHRLIAHHYTRYLGDLSGGQAIGALVRRHYALTNQQTNFYEFIEIDSVVRFKERYRASLDELTLSEPQILELVDEVRLAFHLNHRLFLELEQTELVDA